MPTGRLVKWFCETWVQEFWIFHGVPADAANKKVRSLGWPDPEIGLTGKEGTTRFRIDGGGPIIIWTKPLSNKVEQIEVLVHECVHAANITLSRRGWTPDLNNDEPQTYLVQRLVAKALGS